MPSNDNHHDASIYVDNDLTQMLTTISKQVQEQMLHLANRRLNRPQWLTQ